MHDEAFYPVPVSSSVFVYGLALRLTTYGCKDIQPIETETGSTAGTPFRQQGKKGCCGGYAFRQRGRTIGIRFGGGREILKLVV